MKALLPVIAATFIPFSASAAVVCMDADEMKAALIDWYAEKPVGEPVSYTDSTVQLWASSDSGTWTMVRTYDTQACVVAQGDDWSDPQDAPMLLSQLAD